MMAQYQKIRRSLPDDIILFYRLGDFYEMFFEDAKVASALLNVALTHRHSVPMCGVPYHAAEAYINKLIKANKRVAIAEQTSEPVAGKLVEREVKQIITAATVDNLSLLDDSKNTFLAAVFKSGGRKPVYGLASIEHTTGSFTVAEYTSISAMEDELSRLSPAELLVSDEQLATFGHLPGALPYDAYAYLHDHAHDLLCDHFKVKSLDGYGCGDHDASVCAAGAALHYLTAQLRRSIDHLRTLSVAQVDSHVLIDSASQRNLDLVESRSGRQHTLLGAMDKTATPMGSRKLRDWILHPLRDVSELTARLDLVSAFLEQPFLLAQCRQHLRGIRDIERTTSRLSQGSGNARDLKALAVSLSHIPNLRADLSGCEAKEDSLISELLRDISDFPELSDLFERALADEPPATIKDGGIIKDGFSPDLDELRNASRDGKQWLAQLQSDERASTGIDTLKVKFNNVFGYFLEVTAKNADKVPEHYQRKQTMANAERFITPELKEMEGKILGAEDRSKHLEYEEFLKLRQHVATHIDALQKTASALATLDILLGFSEIAQLHQHTRPHLDESSTLEIVNGRHPVLEQTLIDENFIPNDALLNHETARLVILTGPNMAGKSTYIRQVALITLMAQVGAYVPAEKAHIGLVDRIFCRVGASDDLARGQSTFMVEMNETSLIINNATSKSLVILDEIGRGTATFDGLSIAWSVAEHLHDTIQSRTLFATHYHELCDLASTREAVENQNVAVREWNDEIIFLRKIVPGSADKSYGIQVARLAGLPAPIIERAKNILSHLEMNSTKPETKGKPKAKNTKNTMPEVDSPQMDLFG